MKPLDVIELVLLAALWGASFLFMRVAAPEFGPVALTALRVAGAALLLLPLLVARRQVGALRRHWRPIAIVGLLNSALPFVLFSLAALAISGGLAAIFNATAAMWAALIAWSWFGEKLTPSRLFGLALGFAGVVGLAWGNASLQTGKHGVSPAVAIAAVVFASLCYAFAANYTRKRLVGVPPLAVAAGSQTAAAAMLALPALAWLPPALPGAVAWANVAALAVLCTGVAYLLYFRLIARLGAARAVTVAYLIPLFAMLWDFVFMAERITASMVAGAAVILLGTALATGMLRWPLRPPT